jgi:hypothetical protein
MKYLIAPLVIILCLTGITVAQEIDTTMVILMDGQLWRWSSAEAGAPMPYTECQPPDEPVMSVPSYSIDNREMVFTTQPPIVTGARERGDSLGSDARPNNIWLCGQATGGSNLTLIKSQPPDAAYFVDGQDDYAVAHSIPIWSPDGNKLAWTELHYPEKSNLLSIYDLNSANTTSVQLETEGGAIPLDIMWGQAGIFLRVTYEYSHFDLYDDAGQFISTITIPSPDDFKDFIMRTILMSYGQDEYVGILWYYDGWELLDTNNGDTQMLADISAFPELYHPNNSDGISLILAGPGNQAWAATPYSLYITTDNHTRVYNQDYWHRIALSAAGHIANVNDNDNSIAIWYGDESTQIDIDGNFRVDGISWGPTSWRLRYENGNLIPDKTTCPNLLVSRLVIGQEGRVLPGESNNMREGPAANSELVGKIPGGETFMVLDGPACYGYLAWWQVDYHGLIGWTAEGQGQDYWLEPSEE